MMTRREQVLRAEGFLSTEAPKQGKLRMFKISEANGMAAGRTLGKNKTRCHQNGDQHQTTQGLEGHDEH